MQDTPQTPSPPPGPLIFRRDAQCNGVAPARDMLSSDLPLYSRFPTNPPDEWLPFGAGFSPVGQAEMSEADIQALRDYLQSIDANELVPADDSGGGATPNPHPPSQPQEEEPFWDTSISGPSRGTEDGGVSVESRRGVREYLSSGYTRRNPDGTLEVDNDFGGKWADDFTVVEGRAEHEFFDESVASGSFGGEDSLVSGEGAAFSADASMGAGFEISTPADGGAPSLTADAGASAGARALTGSVETRDDGLLAGSAQGSALSAEAEAKTEVVLSPEEATLSGKLAAEANLLEAGIGGDLYITPRRIANPVINLYNWATSDDVEELGENWDIGIVVGAEVEGSIGAQAGVEGDIGYSDGRATAEAGAKVGLGVGASVKARGGFVGVDKVWNGITSAWNSLWE